MDAFTLHKPVGWRTRNVDRLEHWEKSVLGLAGTSGHNGSHSRDAALHSQSKAVMHSGTHHGWVHGMLHFIRRHRSNLLQQFLNPAPAA